MKKLALLCLFSCISSILFCQTNVSGGIFNDVSWKQSESPYVIVNDVKIFPGAKLTIEPGVKVKFSRNTKITIQGELWSIGTEKDSIHFTSLDDLGQKGYWDKIEMGYLDNAKAYFNYCTFKNASTALDMNATPSRLSNFYLKNSVVSNCIYALNGDRPYGYIEVEYSRIIHNTHGTHHDSSFGIRNSVFSNNDFGMSGSGSLDSCELYNNHKRG